MQKAWSNNLNYSVFQTQQTTRQSASITYLEAIRAAQQKALRDDPRVFIYGQDIADFGGAFKATKGLAKEFPGRVLDSPISEDAQIGMAIGAALEGMRPIIEMQFADFSTCGYTQIVQHAATMKWRTGVPCPIVVRLPSGGTAGAGPFHSQSMEALYAHYPGIIVMTPATVEDAYTMLLEAVEIDDPVIFCEHKYLYYHLKADALPDVALPTGKARVARPGRDATIATYSAMVHESLACAAELATEGWEIEVIDLRSVKPLDTDTILASVSRTGRLLAVGEAFPWAALQRKSSRGLRRKALIYSTLLQCGSTRKTRPSHIIRTFGAPIARPRHPSSPP